MAGVGEGIADADTAIFNVEAQGREVRGRGDGGTAAVVGLNFENGLMRPLSDFDEIFGCYGLFYTCESSSV